jgi:two-component system, sensor histidine kinase
LSAHPAAQHEGMLRAVKHSVRKKLMMVVLAATAVALLLMGISMMVYDLRTYHQTWVNDLISQASLIGQASAPALEFDDEKVAAENLNLLKIRPRISAAAVYTARGSLFATYVRADVTDQKFPALPELDGYRVEGRELVLFKRIEKNNEILGTVYFRARYELIERLLSYLIIMGAVMATSLCVAALMTAWLQGTLTNPILAITDVARQVMTRRDFSLRVKKTTDDEIGYLVDTFNSMLAEIGKRAQALEESNRILEHEMGERRIAQDALLAADRRKDEFLATLAHELRNPLAPLRNALEIIRTSDNNAAAVHSAREMMERQLRQLVHLVNDLLDVSRITTGIMVLKLARVELHAIIENALETASPLIEARKHRLAVLAPTEPVYLMADSIRLAQVFVNLLNNAAKFTGVGGRITFEATQQNGELIVTVTDTGIGIPPDMLPVIFDMFAQVDRSLEREQAGLGVGLSLAKHLVELHGGTIMAASIGLGRGSAFTVRLPNLAEPVASNPARTGSLAADPGTAGHRVLLADDNVDFAESLALILQLTGHEVRVAQDGATALEVAAEFAPDFAFLDIGLPRLNGYELARRLRELPATRQSVLVAVTGWGQDDDKRRAREAGFDHHMVKPVEPDQILDVLATFSHPS